MPFLPRTSRFLPWAMLLVCWGVAGNGFAGQVITPSATDIAMIIASSTGNLPALEKMLNKGLDVDYQDFTGNTPLLYAARYARVEMVQYLLHLGADVNISTHWGTTALMESVRKGNPTVVQALLDAGADVDRVDNRHESALFDAVRYRRMWAVEMLLDRNARVDIKNLRGDTPMVCAVEQHQPQILAELKRRMAEEHPLGDDHMVMTARGATIAGDQLLPAIPLIR